MFTTRSSMNAVLRNPDTATGNKTLVLTAAATVNIDPSIANVLSLTPTSATAINVTGTVVDGQELFVVINTSGVSSFVVTFGTLFRPTGTLATGTTTALTFILSFLCVAGKYVETSRTVAIA